MTTEETNRPLARIRLGLFVVLAFLLVASTFRHPFAFPELYDYRYFLAWLEDGRRSVMWYGDFPLWNPWTCGGQVYLANPQSTIAAPTFLLILAFGTALGTKLMLATYYFFALDGMYRLARDHQLTPESSILAALVFAGNGWLGLHLAVGHINFATGALFPYLLLCHRRAINEPEFAIPLGALMAWIVGMGGTTTPALAIVLLGLSAIFETIRQRSARAIVPLIFAVAVTLIIGAVRFLPVLEFVRAHPRPMNENDATSIVGLLRAAVEWRGLGNVNGFHYGFHEYGWKLPYVALPFLLYAAREWRTRWDFWALVIIGLLIGAGVAIPHGPWSWLKALPMFRDLRVPTRYLVISAIGCSLLVAAGFDALKLTTRMALPIYLAIAALIAVDILAYNNWLFAGVFNRSATMAPRDAKFYQVVGHWSVMFDENLQNHGDINCDEEAPLQRVKEGGLDAGDVPQARLDDPTAGTVAVTAWTPNHYALDVTLQRDTTVLLNANWNEHWETSDGAIVKFGEKHKRDRDGGRLGVALTAGTHHVIVRYRPASFTAGLACSAIGGPALFALFAIMRRRRRARALVAV